VLDFFRLSSDEFPDFFDHQQVFRFWRSPLSFAFWMFGFLKGFSLAD
jgi:hypothetical protein